MDALRTRMKGWTAKPVQPFIDWGIHYDPSRLRAETKAPAPGNTIIIDDR